MMLSALVPALLGGSLILADPGPVRALRDLVFDNYQRLDPRPYDPSLPVRVIDIDDASLARLGQWPWPRALVAKLVDHVREAGAAAIVLDILLAEPDRDSGAADPAPGTVRPGDDALAKSLAEAPSVIGIALGEKPDDTPMKSGFATLGDDPRAFLPRFSGAVAPLPVFVQAAHGIGALNWIPDRDLVVRRVPGVFMRGNTLVPSLALEALRVAQGASTILIKSSNASGETAFGRSTGVIAIKDGAAQIATERDGAIRVRYAGTQRQRHIPAWKLLAGEADLSQLSGSIALIGASAAALTDVRATPLEGAVPGVDVHAEVLEHILSNTSLSRPDYARGLEAVATLIGCLLAAWAAVYLRPLGAALGIVTLLTGTVAASWLAFTRGQVLLDPSLPGLAMGFAFAAANVGALRRSERDKKRIREAFGRYLSPALVETLANDPSRLKLGGEIRPLTVLFSDVRGFTARSETLGAEDVLGFLNAIHAPMTEEVLRSGGTLDKFIGDGLMAFWNAPLAISDHVARALRCALAMQARIAAIDATLAQADRDAGRPHIPLAIGIGLHTGPACVGNIGSSLRFDYSAIGDTVNTAARIEQTTKTYGVPIIVSQEIVEAAPDFTFLRIDRVRLRGRQQLSGLYALCGAASTENPDFAEFRHLHEQALEACEAQSPDAPRLIAQAVRHPLGAGFARLYTLYGERLKAAREMPGDIAGI